MVNACVVNHCQKLEANQEEMVCAHSVHHTVSSLVDLQGSLTRANLFGRTNARQLRNYTSAQS